MGSPTAAEKLRQVDRYDRLSWRTRGLHALAILSLLLAACQRAGVTSRAPGETEAIPTPPTEVTPVPVETPDLSFAPSSTPVWTSSPDMLATWLTLTAAQPESTASPETGAGGPVFTTDIGKELQRRLDSNLALPVCNQSGNQSAVRERWESSQAQDIEAQGGNVQGLYSVLRQKLPAGALIRLCANSEGWYFRVTAANGVPVWNQVQGKDGQWRWADHPNLIPVDAEGNIGEWRPVRLPGNGSSVWAPLVINGVPVEVRLDRDGQPEAYFDPVSDKMESLRPETATETTTPALATPKPDADPQEPLLTELAEDRATLEPPTPIPPTATEKPTVVAPPPEPTATENLAPPNLPTPGGLPWPEGRSPPPGWPTDTVYRGGDGIRLYRWISPGSTENPMLDWELPDFTDVEDCRTDPYCPGVSDEDLTVSQAIILARQIAGDNIRLRIIYIGHIGYQGTPYGIVAIRVQIHNN